MKATPTADSKPIRSAISTFRRHGSVLHTAEAIQRGVHPRTIYEMRDRGLLEALARGVYRLTSAEPLSTPDLAIVALKAPRGIVCLISALAFHGITTQIPHTVDLALPSGARAPRLEYPPVHFIWVSRRTFEVGIEEHVIDHILIRVYSPERTIADCFKYRNQIGLDVAREALQLYVQRKPIRTDALLASAQACRVTKIMTPYVEALL